MPLAPLAPAQPYRVVRTGGRTVMAPQAHARYDAAARALASVDTTQVRRVYLALRPLVGAAYAELAPAGTTFERTLARAIGRLTALPVPASPPELRAKGAQYAYADPKLEALGAAEKHLLRMGPDNMRRVQVKLADVARALELPSAQQAEGP